MNMHHRRLAYCGAIAAYFLTLNGCATIHGDEGQLHVGNALDIYAPFDNSREWGPSYLVGPPGHHLGLGDRIDDARMAPPAR